MQVKLRRIGNSLGVIIPRSLLARWALDEGDFVELSADGMHPPRRADAHSRLDEFKRRLAVEVVRVAPLDEIRRQSLENLQRWKKNGVWCSAYDDWQRIVESDDDGALFKAMLGRDDEANRLRQSPPYVGILPTEALERLREEASG